MAWLLWVTGVHSAAWAVLWGGILSCLGYAAIIPGVYRKFNCHSKGCWRLSHHDYEKDGVTYKLCRTCDPRVDHMNRLRRHHFAQHHKENS